MIKYKINDIVCLYNYIQTELQYILKYNVDLIKYNKSKVFN